RSYPAGPADPLRAKWDGVRSSLALTADAATRFAGLNLPALNLSVNRRILYQADPEGQDIWQTPMGTYRLGTGDCEDFAILKYALLSMANIPVRLVVGEIKKLGMGD